MRVSADGGRTYPRGAERDLAPGLPAAPATVPVYDEGTGTGRMLVLDFDASLARAAGSADPAAEVAAQAAAIAAVVARLAGQCIADVSPSAGRHVYVLFAEPLPWRELRDLADAMRLRYSALDTGPMAAPQSGQIRPPGSPHKRGGWTVLTMPLDQAVDAVRRPCGRQVWSGLLDEFAAELEAAAPADEPGILPPGVHASDDGAPWLPLRGGRIPVAPHLDRVARTGTWPAARYAGRSEARQAVLTGVVACGWQLSEPPCRDGQRELGGAGRDVREARAAPPPGAAAAQGVAKGRRLPRPTSGDGSGPQRG